MPLTRVLEEHNNKYINYRSQIQNNPIYFLVYKTSVNTNPGEIDYSRTLVFALNRINFR
jgi:hypothetical protein